MATPLPTPPGDHLDDHLDDPLTLTGPDGLQIQLRAQGASWVGCQVPLADGGVRSVVLGMADAASHARQQAYLGATVGRWANRIAGPHLTVDGQQRPLPSLPGLDHQLHGGPQGWSHRRWTLHDHGPQHAVWRLHSPDGDQGFPGDVDAEVRYRLLPGLMLQIDHRARVNRRCPVAMTCHAYFNLDGLPPVPPVAQLAGLATPVPPVLAHRLQLAADRVQPVTPTLLPEGPPLPVAGGVFDFRQPRRLDQAWLCTEQQRRVRGIDHGFVLRQPGLPVPGDDRMPVPLSLDPAAVLTASDGRLQLQLFTSAPALQVYTGNYLGPGTAGCTPTWPDHSGVALEPGFLADAPNQAGPGAADGWCGPGRDFAQRSLYRFVSPVG